MSTPIISFSGLASGIDSASLIKSLIDRERQARVQPLQDKITSLGGTNSALGDLKNQLLDLSNAVEQFRSINGGAISNGVVSSDETVASGAASNGAASGIYNVSVTQLAKNATFSFGSSAGSYTSSSAAISAGAAFSDTVTIKIGDPGNPTDTLNISVDENTTLDQFATQINSQTSNAIASVVNVGTASAPNYKLVISSNKTGVEAGQLSVNVGSTLSGRSAFDTNTLDSAADAVFSIAGIGANITRAGNAVSDVIPGLTINLRGAGSSTLSIQPDTAQTTKAVQNLVDAFNKIVSYVHDNDTITKESDAPDALNVFGPLASTSLDQNALSSLRSAFSSISGSGGLLNTLADLGITTQRDGTLELDSDVFSKALASDSYGAGQLLQRLGDKIGGVDGTVAQFTQYNGLIDRATTSNSAQITSLNSRIADVEQSLSKEQDTLSNRFSALEALMSKLNSQQATLSQLLPQ